MSIFHRKEILKWIKCKTENELLVFTGITNLVKMKVRIFNYDTISKNVEKMTESNKIEN